MDAMRATVINNNNKIFIFSTYDYFHHGMEKQMIAVPMSKLWSQPLIAPIFLLMPWSLPSTRVHLPLSKFHFAIESREKV